MRLSTLLALVAAAALLLACSASSRYRVLSTLFDGVPAPTPVPTGDEAGAGGLLLATGPGRLREHGPYAAKQCNACHVTGAGNALVAPAEALCNRCHELPLDKRYVHGPLAAGGCMVCHDPHSSAYPALLVAASTDFCLRCHERADLGAAVAGHREPAAGEAPTQCTSCHEAHMSDLPHLLRR